MTNQTEMITPNRILENIPEGVFAINRNCLITFFNQKAEEITGYPRKQAVGMYCYEIFRPEICQSNCSIKESMATGKELFDHQVNILDRSDKPLSIRIHTSPLKNEVGEIVGGLQTFHVIDRPPEAIQKELVLFELRKKIGRDARLLNIYEILPDLAQSDAPVLLHGENGTGKAFIAEAIHRLSHRRNGPYIHVLCMEKSELNLAMELLGGRPSNAHGIEDVRIGLLEKGHKGTIFLEGIEVLSYKLQARILKAMEDGKYEPPGAEFPIPSDIRLIASTERDLEEKVREGTFPQNLFYCLNVFKIQLPPLRTRKEDILCLAKEYVWRLTKKRGKEVTELSPDVISLLQEYTFPGNIRELENILEHSHLVARNKTIRVEDLPARLIKGEPVDSRTTELRESEELDQKIILDALIQNSWSRKRAAQKLGIDRTTLWRKMKRMGIHPGSRCIKEEEKSLKPK